MHPRIPRTLVALTVCFVLSVSAWPAAQQAPIEEELDQAKSLYQDGRLGEAIGALRSVIVRLNELRDVQDRTRQLAEAHFHLGLAYLAMRNESAATENFRQVAALDPDRTLDPEIHAPRVLDAFERARSDVVRRTVAENSPGPALVEGRVLPEGGVTALAPAAALLRILPGTKMRVERTGRVFAVEGRLLAVDNDVLTIGSEDWRLDVPRDSLTRVQVVTARKNHWLQGMLIGAGLGVLIGALEVPGCGGNDGDCYTRGENMGYGGLGLGLIGALIGALYQTDQWGEVPVGESASRTRGEQRLALSIAWRY